MCLFHLLSPRSHFIIEIVIQESEDRNMEAGGRKGRKKEAREGGSGEEEGRQMAMVQPLASCYLGLCVG